MASLNELSGVTFIMWHQLDRSHGNALAKRALQYFKEKGIDPTVEPPEPPPSYSVRQTPRFSAEAATAGMKTLTCTIEIASFGVWTYCGVTIPGLNKEFEGEALGVGAGGLTAVGVIYYENEGHLLATDEFGVLFAADLGGSVYVTWGANGNATAHGLGLAVGAFYGRGSWKNPATHPHHLL